MTSVREHPTALRRVLVAVAVVVAGLLAPSLAQAAPQPTPPVEAVIDAGGQRQWISCAGTGSPTVVISSGLGASHSMWSRVLPQLRRITRVCITDRPGLGSSPPRTGAMTTDAGQHARELRAVLDAAGEHGPYLLVGHSYAGLVVRAFAAQAPSDVAGMLLVDACWPGIHRDFLPSYRSPWHEGGTLIDMAVSETADAGGPDLGSRPLIVLAAGDPSKDTSAADRAWFAHQAQAATLSSKGQLRFARHSGHVIQQDRPRQVIDAVRDLVAQVRAEQRTS